MDKTIIIVVAIITLAGAGFWAWQAGFFSGPVKPVVVPAGIILFYGEGCPHCKVVDDFVSQNKIEDKVKFIKLEVWHNADNQEILSQVATQKCGITSTKIGVPFLFDGNNKCYIGDVDVISFLKNAAGIK